MNGFHYLTVAEVITIHAILIKKYGGSEGIRDPGALEAALYRPQTGYYSGAIEQAAALVESLGMNHPVVDGNKRVSFAVMDIFLRINGYRIEASSKAIEAWMMERFKTASFDFESWAQWLKLNTKAV